MKKCLVDKPLYPHPSFQNISKIIIQYCHFHIYYVLNSLLLLLTCQQSLFSTILIHIHFNEIIIIHYCLFPYLLCNQFMTTPTYMSTILILHYPHSHTFQRNNHHPLLPFSIFTMSSIHYYPYSHVNNHYSSLSSFTYISTFTRHFRQHLKYTTSFCWIHNVFWYTSSFLIHNIFYYATSRTKNFLE